LLTQIICTKNCRNIIKKTKIPRSYRVCPTSKRKEKEQKKSKFMPDKPRSRIKKENENKAPA